MKKLILSAVILFLSVGSNFAQEVWKLDRSHSSVKFGVDHMVITEVEGQFQEFETELHKKDGKFEKVVANIKTNSIDTDNEKRDDHLRGDDFFNVEKFPELKFESKKFEDLGNNKYKITGDLTIRDVTKTVVLEAKFNGEVKDPRGNTRVGWKATTAINRFDYNLKWNNVLEAGGLVVGDEVRITLNMQYIKS